MVLRLFRALMPKEERFLGHFTDHAGCIVEAADALAMMMANPQDRERHFKEVCAIEGRADVITRNTVVALHRAFITPFDRSDILALTNSLDDAVDLIEEVVQHAALYGVSEFDPRMREFTGMIRDAAGLLARIIPLLENITRNADEITRLCDEVGGIEGKADQLLRQALRELIDAKPDPITFMGHKEVYERLETVTDRCNDVADVIEGIVLDHV
ncbi:MAG: DUF47 domain-containing protein [Alphaproteobacteria bacterium]|nr:DUF47 domain-containing protein [Alphaproteobacteria bacterium]MBF0391983.1 DUF47 domain-containing protein [Alphaproteobacteria bacterium]